MSTLSHRLGNLALTGALTATLAGTLFITAYPLKPRESKVVEGVIERNGKIISRILTNDKQVVCVKGLDQFPPNTTTILLNHPSEKNPYEATELLGKIKTGDEVSIQISKDGILSIGVGEAIHAPIFQLPRTKTQSGNVQVLEEVQRRAAAMKACEEFKVMK